MTAPVDVLAVMDSCTDELEKQPGCYYTDAAKLQEARAAIAELIEADKEYDAAKRQVNDETLTAEEHNSASWPRLYAAQDRRLAALARVGATK